MSRRFAENPVYIEHEELLKQLHAAIARGDGESKEAERIRNRMDRTFAKLTPEERERLEGLSADLYMLTDEEVVAKRPADLATADQLRKALHRAYVKQDVIELLRLMRFGIEWLNPAERAFFRGRQYDKLGHLHTASLFYRKATELNAKAEYRAVLLAALDRLGDKIAVDYARELIAGDRQSMVVIFAAGVIHRRAPAETIAATSRDLIPRLEAAIKSRRDSLPDDPLPTVLTCGFAILASCYQESGDLSKAIQTWSRSIEIGDTPHKWLDYVARAQLFLESGDLDRAADDFQKAVDFGAQAGLPYAFLAHGQFGLGNYTKALELLERAISLETSPSFLADCWELKAIVQASLGVSPKRVRGSFAHAVACDPFNDRIKTNAAIYEAVLDAKRQKEWKPSLPKHQFDVLRAFSESAMRDLVYVGDSQAA